jgi:hypothetical protein
LSRILILMTIPTKRIPIEEHPDNREYIFEVNSGLCFCNRPKFVPTCPASLDVQTHRPMIILSLSLQSIWKT